jgi:hypothetical protein
LKKLVIAAALGVSLLFAGASSGLAQEDVTIEIVTGHNLELPSYYEESVEAQESVISYIEEVTGQKVNHYYIILEVDGTKVIAIDPPTPYY